LLFIMTLGPVAISPGCPINKAMPRRFFGHHYALAVIVIIFVALLAAAGLRSTPGVLMVPWGEAFGWSRQTISFAAATGIFLFGLTGPFAAAAMQHFGIRATVIAALVMMSLSTAASLFMTQAWQLILTWGVVSGIGSGCITNVLSATIVNRWFVTNRGLVMGLFAASTSTGTLIFLPVLSAISLDHGWKPVVFCVALAMALLVPLVFFLLPESPADIGAVPFGADSSHPVEVRERSNPLKAAFSALAEGSRSRVFWLLSITFFVCGFTTNGLVGTHMIALCHDHGMDAVAAGGLLAIMGLFDLVGTTASGWLTDRIDPRKLLAWYYTLRGLSLLIVPFLSGLPELAAFAVIFGLDYIATVPPTTTLCADIFGRKHVGTIFGWIFASHQLGAALIASLAGVARVQFGTYDQAFLATGLFAVAGGLMALAIQRAPRPAPLPAAAAD
jgi:MFS family permease